jgi:hypothetical protein
VFSEVHADLRRRGEDPRLFLVIAKSIFRAIGRIDSLTDADVSIALADLHDHFSPLELIAHPPSLLGRFLFEHIDREIEGDIATHERVREILPRMKKMVEMLRDSEAPRAFLQGLSAHMEIFFPEGTQDTRSSLTLTPGVRRRF